MSRRRGTEGRLARLPRHLRRGSGAGNVPPSAVAALTWLTAMIVVALLADWIAPYDYAAMALRDRLLPPFWMDGAVLAHPLGTDDLGRDILSRLIHSVRLSLFVALLGTAIGAALGTVVGVLAAHFGGWIDDLSMIAIDFQAALPFLILALAALAVLGNSLTIFIVVMGLYGWERYARIARNLTMSAKAQGYAIALQVLGASPFRIYFGHVLPNIASALLVNMTLNFPEAVLLETALSFLGVGIQPPLTSLGNMIGFGRDYLLTAWWIAVLPASVIFITTLALSILGDWLRDRMDPALRGG